MVLEANKAVILVGIGRRTEREQAEAPNKDAGGIVSWSAVSYILCSL